jgi:LysM repeat protein
MATDHTVVQGEHLSSIAKEYGFSTYLTIWNHPNNAALKQQRQNPNVLYPGDHLFIPDRELRQESRPTDKQHLFQKKGGPLKLRVVLEDQYEKPIAHAKCLLSVDGDFRTVTTDGTGRIEQTIPPTARSVTLVIRDPQTPVENNEMSIKIGNLDPVNEVSGQQGRLINLGYLVGDVNQVDQTAFESAVEEFQCDQSLTVDGICGPQTQAKLKQVHGC